MPKIVVEMEGDATSLVAALAASEQAGAKFNSQMSTGGRAANAYGDTLTGASTKAQRMSIAWMQAKDTTGQLTDGMVKVASGAEKAGNTMLALGKGLGIAGGGFSLLRAAGVGLPGELGQVINLASALSQRAGGLTAAMTTAANSGLALAAGIAAPVAVAVGAGLAFNNIIRLTGELAEENAAAEESYRRSIEPTKRQQEQMAALGQQLGMTREDMANFTTANETGFQALTKYANENPQSRIAAGFREMGKESRETAAALEEQRAAITDLVDLQVATEKFTKASEGISGVADAWDRYGDAAAKLHTLPAEMKKLAEETGDAALANRMYGESFLAAYDAVQKMNPKAITAEMTKQAEAIRATTAETTKAHLVEKEYITFSADGLKRVGKVWVDVAEEIRITDEVTKRHSETMKQLGDTMHRVAEQRHADARQATADLKAASDETYGAKGHANMARRNADPNDRMNQVNPGFSYDLQATDRRIDAASAQSVSGSLAAGLNTKKLGAFAADFAALIALIDEGDLGKVSQARAALERKVSNFSGAGASTGGSTEVLGNARALLVTLMGLVEEKTGRDEGGRFTPQGGGGSERSRSGGGGFSARDVQEAVKAGVVSAFATGGLKLTDEGGRTLAQGFSRSQDRGEAPARR